MSLLQQLTLSFCGFALLPLLLFGAVDYSLSVDHLKTTAMRELHAISDIQRQRLLNQINQQQQRLEMVSRHPALQRALYLAQNRNGDTGDIGSALDITLGTALDIKEALVYDRDGTLLSRNLSDGYRNIAGDAEKTRQPVPLFGYDQLEQPEVRIDGPIVYRGEQIGSLRLRTDARALLRIFTDYSGMGASGESLLVQVDSHGNVSAMHPRRHGAPRTLDYKLFGAASTSQQEAYNILDHRGEAILLAGQLLPEFNWGIIVKRDLREILGPAQALLARLNLFIIAIAIIGAALALRVARSIHRPIAELTCTAEKIRAGDLSQRANSDGHSEISVLANAMNAMLDQLICDNARLESTVAMRAGEAEAARQRAEECSRLQGEFLANMSHEVRTPMNGILGIASLLKRSTQDPQQCEYLQIIENSGSNLLTIIDDILELSKANAGHLTIHPRDFRLSIELRSLLDQSREAAAAKGLEFTVEITEQLPEALHGDAPRLLQVLQQLIGNAIKFTQHGGILLQFDWQQDGIDATLIMRLHDSGIGIDKPQQELIFKPFVQIDGSTTRRYGGTGLGLSIAARLVALMHGEISVESRKNKGSTFTVTLPIQRASSAPHIYPQQARNRKDNRIQQLSKARGEPPQYLSRELLQRRSPFPGGAADKFNPAHAGAALNTKNLAAMDTSRIPARNTLSLAETPVIVFEQQPEELDTMILDEQRLRDITRNKPALISSISSLFISELPDMCASIDSAIEQKDRDALSQAIHRMKSALGNFACADFYQEFSSLEAQAKNNQLSLDDWLANWQQAKIRLDQLQCELKDIAGL